MTTVTVDGVQAEAMVKTGELVEIRDAAGTVIGFFAPLKLEYARDYAETAARAYSVWGPEGMPRHLTTPAEVIAYLEAREKVG
jgi:hypothetical protein